MKIEYRSITLSKTDYEKLERLAKAWNMTTFNVVKTAINQEIKMLDQMLS